MENGGDETPNEMTIERRPRVFLNDKGHVLRSFSTILIDADHAETIEELQFFVDELMDERDSYPSHQIEFAKEHFFDLLCQLSPACGFITLNKTI